VAPRLTVFGQRYSLLRKKTNSEARFLRQRLSF
jgi:hypothetical protein